MNIYNSANNLGDCVACSLCVQVCPTGIDIRNGTQLECVNCTACIDACNEVMVKIDKPKGLIGFYNHEYIQQRKPFTASLRAYGYAAVLFVVIMVFSSLIYRRQNVETIVLRASGTTFQTRPDGLISNLYNAELINKTNKDIKFVFKSTNSADRIQFIQAPKLLPKEGSTNITFFLIKHPKTLQGYKTKVEFEIIADKKIIGTAKTSFFAQPN